MLLTHGRKGIGKAIRPISRSHPGTVSWPPRQRRTAGGHQARQNRCGLAIPDRDYPGYEAPVLRDIDGLTTSYTRQHFTRVVAQVSKLYYVRIRSCHGTGVSQARLRLHGPAIAS